MNRLQRPAWPSILPVVIGALLGPGLAALAGGLTLSFDVLGFLRVFFIPGGVLAWRIWGDSCFRNEAEVLAYFAIPVGVVMYGLLGAIVVLAARIVRLRSPA